MVRLLKVRPRDGWRVFAGEVGVIVLGVLIALGAQQVADDWAWKQKVARTNADLNAQLARNIVYAAERIAVAPCLSQRIAALGAKVAASDGRWTADPYILPGEAKAKDAVRYTLPLAYRAPGRSYPVDVWEQAKASGVLAHMTPADIEARSYAAASIRTLSEGVAAERDLGSDLAALSFDGALGAAERARLLATLSRLDRRNRDAVNTAEQLADDGRKLGVRFNAENRAGMRDILTTQRQFRGSCVDAAAAMRAVAPLWGADR